MLSAEDKPTEPFIVCGRSEAVSIDDVEACWLKLGLPAAAGRVRVGPAITREGRRWIKGAFAVFCFTFISHVIKSRPTLRIGSFHNGKFTIREPRNLAIAIQSYH